MSESESDLERPVLHILDEHATPEEIAALIAVLAASGSAEPPRRRTPEWAARHRTLRQPHHAGPGAWRSSGLPH